MFDQNSNFPMYDSWIVSAQGEKCGGGWGGGGENKGGRNEIWRRSDGRQKAGRRRDSSEKKAFEKMVQAGDGKKQRKADEITRDEFRTRSRIFRKKKSRILTDQASQRPVLVTSFCSTSARKNKILSDKCPHYSLV